MSIKPKKLEKYMIPLIGLGKNNWQAIDISIEEYGSQFVILAASGAGKEWVEGRLSLCVKDSPHVNGVIVDAEFVDDLIEEIERAGLRISGSEQGEHIDWRNLMNEISKN